jgi:hypothetical protein
MATIRSGATTDELTIDPTSKAARVTIYSPDGTILTTDDRATYHAGGRLAAGTGLSFAFSSTTSKQVLTIYHTAGSTKLVRLLKAWFTIISASAATQIVVELVSLTSATTPATGNPAITPISFVQGDPAAEATVLALPTTAGTEVTTTTGIGTTAIDFTGASASTDVRDDGIPAVLYKYDPLAPTKQPTMRAGNAEGWAIRMFPNNTTPTLVFTCGFEFTEE